MIEIRNLCFGYIKKPFCIKDLNINIKKGEGVALLGGEGMGKTSLLKVFAGIEKQYAGSIKLNGEELYNVPIEKRNISYLPSEPVLFNNKSLMFNLEYLFKVMGTKKLSETDIKNIFKKFDFDFDLKTKVKNLSISDKKIFAIIRSYIKNADILLVDDQFINETQENGQKIKNALLLLINENLRQKCVVSVYNSVFDTKYNKYLYLSYANGYVYQNIKDIEKSFIDGFVSNYFNFQKFKFVLLKKNQDYFLCEYDEIVDKKRKNKSISVKNTYKMSKKYNSIFENIELYEDEYFYVEALSNVFVEEINNSNLLKLIDEGNLHLFEASTKVKII